MDDKIEIFTDYSLYLHNTLRIAARSKYFAQVTSVAQLRSLFQTSCWRDAERIILGEGSNVLFTRDFPGLVVHNAIKGIFVTDLDNDRVRLTLGAGERWDDVVAFANERGYYGIENLSWIPGTVGGAPVQNIGAYGAELKDVFLSLDAMQVNTGEIHRLTAEQCAFGYRDSAFKHKFRDLYVITQVELCLSKIAHFNLSYYALRDYFADIALDQLSLKKVREGVIAIRNSKLPDPNQLPNAGSFFKNPRVSQAQYSELSTQYNEIPKFPADEELIKIPAAWLIERCGWKGKSQGPVGVHAQQALVLINHGGATGDQVKALAQSIQLDVQKKFGIELEPEVNYI